MVKLCTSSMTKKLLLKINSIREHQFNIHQNPTVTHSYTYSKVQKVGHLTIAAWTVFDAQDQFIKAM